MQVNTYRVLLFILCVWMQTGSLVRGQDCRLSWFTSSNDFDSNFDTSGLKESYLLGSTVRVPCHVGHAGSFRMMCVSDVGVRWDYQGSKCQLKPCGHPGDADFAEYQLVRGDDFVFGSEVEYTCKPGYQMVSRSNRRRCEHFGWDGFVPVCEAMRCPEVHVDDDMLVTGENMEATYGHVLLFKCKQKDMDVKGAREIYCKETGQWSAEPPTCEAKTCGPPGDVQFAKTNGPQEEEYALESEVQYSCRAGYRMDRAGSGTRRCTLNGWEWVGAEPRCEACNCYLGIKNSMKLITNEQMSASSVKFTGAGWHAHFGRLDEWGARNAWTAATNDQQQWLQVDLGCSKTITGIITQGDGGVFVGSSYVTSFRVSYLDDRGRRTENETDKTYDGNIDSSSYKTNMFDPPVTARYVRVLPQAWHDGIALRMELLGCEPVGCPGYTEPQSTPCESPDYTQ